MAKIPEPLHSSNREPEPQQQLSQLDINTEWIMKNLRRCKKFKNGANNHEFNMCSPLRKDNSPSFSVNAEKGVYHDYGTGEHGTLSELARLMNVDAPAYAGSTVSTYTPAPVAATAGQPAASSKAQPAGQKPQKGKAEAQQALLAEWNAGSTDIKSHPYILKKGINPSFVDWRVCTAGSFNGWLMIPARDMKGQLQAIQYISTGGKKSNSAGGEISHAVWIAGAATEEVMSDAPEVILCEGAATAATVKELRPAAAVFCTFSASNMAATAQLLKSAFVESDFIIAADCGKTGEKVYTEIIQGKQATASEAGRLPIEDALKAIPRKKKIVPSDADYSDNTDWNDIATLFGKDYAAAELDKCIKWDKIFHSIQAQAAEERRLTAEGGRDLFATEDAPAEWIIKDLLPEGLTVLAGHPKKGKSFLALQMSLAVASGEIFMNQATKKGAVLHMALEDGRRRTKERIKYLDGREKAKNAFFAFSCPRFTQNGLRELLNFIRDVEPVLIVVDVWNTVKPPVPRGSNLNAYEADHDAASVINKLGMETHTAILMVHHMRKGAANSEVMTEKLSGSQGLPAAASAILTLIREDNSQHAILYRSGRDYEDDEPLQIHFSRGQNRDGEPFGWRPATKEEIDANAEPRNENDVNILNTLEAVAAEGKDGLTMKQLIARTGIKQPTLYKRLKQLASTGEVKKSADGVFSLVAEDSDGQQPAQPEARLHIDEIIANAKARQQAQAEAEAAAKAAASQPAGQQVLADIGESVDID